MPQKNVYNLIGDEKSYIQTVLAADGVELSNKVDAIHQETQIIPPEANNASKVDAQIEYKGKKKKKSIDFQNLEGDLDITPTPKNFRIVPGMTVKIVGVGKFLSGYYYVMNRSTNISGSSPMSLRLTVIKTNFGKDLKGDKLETIKTEDLIGDKDTKSSGKSSGKNQAVDNTITYPPATGNGNPVNNSDNSGWHRGSR